MTEIYIIRHVQAEGNLYRMCQGHWDGDVTPLGRQQREALAERFRDVQVDAVYSSDLYRARFTATAITKYHELPITLDSRLREMNLGHWEGQFFGNLIHNERDEFIRFIYDQENFNLKGAETYQDVTRRAMPALEEIVKKHQGETVVITSHGVTMRCLLCPIAGIALNDNASLPIFKNTGVAKLRYEDGKFEIDYLNDYSHLTEELLGSGVKGFDLRHEYIDPGKHSEYYTQCYERAWLSAHGDLRGYEAETYLAAAMEHHAADGEAVSIMYHEDKPVGLMDLDTMRGEHASYGWISLFYLEPEYRHQGCGIQLLGRAMQKYSSLGRSALRLTVAEDNREALSFYKKWGFKELSREPGNKLLMEKKLVKHEHL